ncbi:MAG: hypothetical protein ACK5LX_06450 [Oscillospiraceae bacterium]
MKKITLALTLIFVMLTLGGCSLTEFDGSRTGNQSQLIMDYKVLNTTDSQILELQEGDSVDFVVTSESGALNITLQKEDDEPIYRGIDIPTSTFTVEIDKTGSYTVSVTGENAKGGVSIVKRESN